MSRSGHIMKNDENIIVKDERVCKYDDIIFEKMSKLNQKKSLTVKEKKNILLQIKIYLLL